MVRHGAEMGKVPDHRPGIRPRRERSRTVTSTAEDTEVIDKEEEEEGEAGRVKDEGYRKSTHNFGFGKSYK